MATKTNATVPTLTRAVLIDKIFNIDPTIKGLKQKKKDELLTLYANLTGKGDTSQKKLARENAELRERLKQEREEVNFWRQRNVAQHDLINTLRQQNDNLKNKTPPNNVLQNTKTQLTNIVELIDNLAKNDHLNTEASRQLNNELLKAYNLLTNKVNTFNLEFDLDDISDDEEDNTNAPAYLYIGDNSEDQTNPFDNLN